MRFFRISDFSGLIHILVYGPLSACASLAALIAVETKPAGSQSPWRVLIFACGVAGGLYLLISGSSILLHAYRTYGSIDEGTAFWGPLAIALGLPAVVAIFRWWWKR